MDTGQPEVFTVVPSYNHAAFIGKCLRSIIGQTSAPRKLLVIDDGSTDGSPDVIANELRNCPFPSELIVRENRGLCATLNQALSLADGKYFAYLGADDIWLPPFLEARSKMMDENAGAVLGYGHAYIVDEEDRVVTSTPEHGNSWANYHNGNAREMLLDAISPISSTVFYRRSALENVAWNESSRLEDFEMYIKLVTLGEFVFDPTILAAWREHTNNTSKDLEMMLGEVLRTQDRNISDLDVSREELDRRQMKTRFRYARKLLQHGEKGEALRLARSNWRGSESVTELAAFALRMALPMKAVELKRKMDKRTPLKVRLDEK
ncbi:hypothetical protein BH10ACI2_BH10ACI2_03850 [soil metagenome]